METLGGQENWDRARYLRFDFVVKREGKIVSTVKHLWDRYTGRYRLEGKTREKGDYVVLFEDINAKQGQALSQWQSRPGGGPQEADRYGLWPLHQRHLLAADALQVERSGGFT